MKGAIFMQLQWETAWYELTGIASNVACHVRQLAPLCLSISLQTLLIQATCCADKGPRKIAEEELLGVEISGFIQYRQPFSK